MLIVVAFLFGAVVAVFRQAGDSAADFQHFWLSARYWTHPYDHSIWTGEAGAPYWWPEMRRFDEFLYMYPPPMLLFMWPLSRLPMLAAFALFNGVTSAIFMNLCVRRVGWLSVVVFFSLPWFCGLITGQIGLLASCGAIAAFEMIERRPRVAGVIFAAMVCIKPQVAIAAPFVLWGRWDTVKAGVLGGVSILLASLVFGPQRWLEWVHQFGPFKEQLSLLPQIMPYLLFGHAIWWRGVLIVVGLAFATWERGLVGFTVGTLFCTPYFELYDLAALSFLGLLIVAEWKSFGPLKGLAPSMLGLLLVICPSYSETITIFCLCLIALRVLAGRSSLGRAIEFVRPRTFPPVHMAPVGSMGS